LSLPFEPLALFHLGAGVAQNLSRRFLGLKVAFSATLILQRLPVIGFAFEVIVHFFAFVVDRFVGLSLLVMQLLAPLLTISHVLGLLLSHSLVKLLFVEFFGHLAIENKLLVKRVAQGDLRWQGRLWRGQAVVVHEAHRVFAKSRFRAGYHPIHLVRPISAHCHIHRRWVRHHRQTLTFDSIDDTLLD